MSTIKMLRMIVICFICCMALCSQFINAAETPQSSQKDTATIVAYYFHGDFRCSNCFTIEQYSKEAIEKYFPEQLKNGKLTFNVINTDRPTNEHFVKDYQLYTRSLILAEFKNGKQVKWTNLSKVWDYINDRDAFYNYVKAEIEKYLKSL